MGARDDVQGGVMVVMRQVVVVVVFVAPRPAGLIRDESEEYIIGDV